MIDTSPSLLERLSRRPDDRDWRRLVTLYTPVLHAWLRPYGLQPSDLDDLTQEVLGVVVRELPDFRHNQRVGAFRAWLRTIVVHRLRRFWRTCNNRPAAGGSDVEDQLAQLEDPASGLSAEWDREHDRRLVQRLMQLVEGDFQPKTWRAFRLLVLDGRSPAEAAAELGMTANAVLVAKARVLQRLREEAGGLID